MSELNRHMVCHLEVNSEDSVKDSLSSTGKKKFHFCSICNKKFRRPCEVKEHMMSHNCTSPFICKYCGKKLKSKTGSIYHVLKTHKIDVNDTKKLDEHFFINSNESKSKNENIHTKPKSENIKLREEEKQSSSDFEQSYSSEDELPLAERRKQLIHERIKKVRTIRQLQLNYTP